MFAEKYKFLINSYKHIVEVIDFVVNFVIVMRYIQLFEEHSVYRTARKPTVLPI